MCLISSLRISWWVWTCAESFVYTHIFRVFFSFPSLESRTQSPWLASLDRHWVFSGTNKIRFFALSFVCIASFLALCSPEYSDIATDQVIITFTVILLEEKNTFDSRGGMGMKKTSSVSFWVGCGFQIHRKAKSWRQSPEKNDLVHFRLHFSFPLWVSLSLHGKAWA